ncbi:MAG: GDSL family lipase [Roseiflexaceae bacterium]
MPLRIQPNNKLVMIGDSITDCERARPIGEGLFGALGKGYVGLVDGLLQATIPQQHVRVVNMGIRGNTVRDLDARWQTDVLEQQPDPMRAQMDRYGAVVREVASAHEAVFIDTQAAFDHVLAQLHPMTLAWDRVHPTLAGHMVLARAFLNAVGFEWAE